MIIAIKSWYLIYTFSPAQPWPSPAVWHDWLLPSCLTMRTYNGNNHAVRVFFVHEACLPMFTLCSAPVGLSRCVSSSELHGEKKRIYAEMGKTAVVAQCLMRCVRACACLLACVRVRYFHLCRSHAIKTSDCKQADRQTDVPLSPSLSEKLFFLSKMKL